MVNSQTPYDFDKMMDRVLKGAKKKTVQKYKASVRPKMREINCKLAREYHKVFKRENKKL